MPNIVCRLSHLFSLYALYLFAGLESRDKRGYTASSWFPGGLRGGRQDLNPWQWGWALTGCPTLLLALALSLKAQQLSLISCFTPQISLDLKPSPHWLVALLYCTPSVRGLFLPGHVKCTTVWNLGFLNSGTLPHFVLICTQKAQEAAQACHSLL